MSQADVMLANAAAIETHGNVLKAKGVGALAATYIAKAALLRHEAAMLLQPMAVAA